MEEPLQVRKNENGTFQDIYGRPMIVIFNPEQRKPRARKIGSKVEISTVTSDLKEECNKPPRLEFVNLTGPVKINQSSRKLIRAHVMRDHVQQKRSRKLENIEHGEKEAQKQLISGTLGIAHSSIQNRPLWPSWVPQVRRQEFGSLDPFAQFPVKMMPHMYNLASQFLTLVGPATCPIEPYCERDPTEADWFDLAMKDAALFHVILCGSAMYFDLLQGTKRSRERELHMMEVVKLLVTRINESASGISDATISTVAFLAKIECILGNYEKWSMHIDGLEQMIQTRGGLPALNIYVQWKIHRADMMGCAEFGSTPRFPSADGSLAPNQPIMILPRTSTLQNFERITLIHRLSSDLVYALKTIQHLTASVNNAYLHDKPMDVRTIDSMVTAIRRLVLSVCSNSLNDNDEERTTAANPSISPIQAPLRLGALIYIKTLIPQPPFPYLPTPVLISRFQTALDHAKSNAQSSNPNETLAPVLLWLAFVGGMFLNRENERKWFVRFAADLGEDIRQWDAVKENLAGFWWVESLHSEAAKRFWREVVVYDKSR